MAAKETRLERENREMMEGVERPIYSQTWRCLTHNYTFTAPIKPTQCNARGDYYNSLSGDECKIVPA